ncbi:MAG TPA: glycosyltransferase family 9 protein [Puia sp.]|nr:glycosyltransferase family 9 protein [Puia sp.]
MKFLIIRFSSIGDIVLTTPVVRCLKKQIPTAEIHYLTKSNYSAILAPNPYVDKLHFLEENLNNLVSELRNEDFDYIIDLHHNLRTLTIKKALDKKAFSYEKLNIEKWIYVNFKWNSLPDIHIVDRYMKTVESFGVKNDGAGLDYFIADDEYVKEKDIPASHSAGYIGISIGAALNTKKYPFHKARALCESLDHPIILLGGLEDADEGERIAAVDPVKIYNACGKFSLNESADLVRRAKLIVSNDTGLMHIATAFKKPVISLWGNTVPEFGMYPYYGENYLSQHSSPFDILEIKNLSCRPCSKIGYDKCPKGHFKCMELITTNSILDKIDQRIRNKVI